MAVQLTEVEIEEFKMGHQTENDGKKRDRIKAILMLNDGYRSEEISKILMININTITGWKKRYINRKDGREWLMDRYRGYEGKLSVIEEAEVSDYVSVLRDTIIRP